MKKLLGIAALLAALGCEDTQTEPSLNDAGQIDVGVDASSATDLGVSVTDRAFGERVARNLECDPLDPLICASPWPNNAFTQSAETPTGLRLAVAPAAVAKNDVLLPLNRIDGFSTLSTLTIAFEGTLDESSFGGPYGGAVQLWQTDPRVEFPLAIKKVEKRFNTGAVQTLLVANPLRPLNHNSDYVAVVTGQLRGQNVAQDAWTAVAVGATPQNDDEVAFAAYHAPTRQTLSDAGISADQVIRVWDFTTRSNENLVALLPNMMQRSVEAVENDAINLTVTKVTVPQDGPIALIVEGLMGGLPNFLNNDVIDADGAQVYGQTSTVFRVMVPRGTGDYRAVMYGHGTGGELGDPAFDDALAGLGIAKVSLEWTGWTETGLPQTAFFMNRVLDGSWRSTSKLLQALGHGAAVQASLDGVLGDLLAAEQIDGQPNPVAGRRPDMRIPVWTGGSMGGTLGLVYTLANPTLDFAVLNVPGAAWTHWIPDSDIYAFFSVLLNSNYPTLFDVTHALAMAQLLWDPVDGGAYDIPEDMVALIQESVGDPILPNAGTNMVATATRAVQLGEVIVPIEGVQTAVGPVSQTAVTQYRVNSTEPYAIHGFGAGDSPAGVAARAQILSFLSSVWAGDLSISVPAECPDQNCDFGP
ncbi:MAG: hypothetical protein R3E66_06540 [bacterium]